MWWALLFAAFAEGEAELDAESPTDATVIYYNARLQLREERPLESVRLWFLRNAFEDQTGRVSIHDADFHSVTWAALGDLGICQDGLPRDDDGAGLWTVALHNWVVRNRTRKSWPKRLPPFKAFELDRQQRFISIGDVLSSQELRTVHLFQKKGCIRPRLALLSAGEVPFADLSDRQTGARLMQHLLERSRDTLVPERVRGMAAIDARLFDLHLKLAELSEREARLKENSQARRGRELGLSKASVTALRDEADRYTFADYSEPARILRECQEWSIDEWMSLSPGRRRSLFHHAKRYGAEDASLDRIALGVIDALIALGEGSEVEKWMADRGRSDDEWKTQLWASERGKRLLALDAESGFRERGPIALYRGVDFLERGDMPAALRSMAHALQASATSRSSDDVRGLSLRWLSYIAGQFEITDELLITLQELVPRRDYAILLEDLMWGAALRADLRSFERGERNQAGRGALERRLALLRPLAHGNIGQFSTKIRTGLRETPSETVRFLKLFVQRVELENADIRRVHLRTLVQLRELLRPMADPEEGGRQGRTASTLLERVQAIIDGLGGPGPDAKVNDWARLLDPSGEVYAGAVRLAPADPLPWPFRQADVSAPSVYVPMRLVPKEWRDDDGAWVFGWSLEG
jgi:hypothetical protein